MIETSPFKKRTGGKLVIVNHVIVTLIINGLSDSVFLAEALAVEVFN